MTAPGITLRDFEEAEQLSRTKRRASADGARRHHRARLSTAHRHQHQPRRRVPWSAFAVGGMTIGLAAHWWLGYCHLDTELATRQQKIEDRAAHLH